MHLITSGAGTFISNGIAHHVQRGDLYLFFTGDHIQYFDTPDTPWQYRWCSLAGPFIPVLADCGIKKGDYLHRCRNVEGIIDALDAVEHVCKNDTPSSHLGNVALHMILNDIGRPKPAPTLSTAHQAKSIIDSWSFDYPTVEDVADGTGVSRSTLFRQFKAEYGLSVKEYIDEIRLTKAARLLRMSVEPIKSIAKSCGYWDQLYFSRAFSKRYGESPTQWRRSSERSLTAEEEFARLTAQTNRPHGETQ